MRMIDLDGKTVVPGFTDSHCHIFGVGEREMNLNLAETNALENFVAKIKERVAKIERDNGHWARLDRDLLEIFDGARPREIRSRGSLRCRAGYEYKYSS